jgi:hypothetical protein
VKPGINSITLGVDPTIIAREMFGRETSSTANLLFASLFIEDGAWRIPSINASFERRQEIRAGIERMQGLWDYFVQTPRPGTIQLEGDTAVSRAYVSELGHLRDGSLQKKV